MADKLIVGLGNPGKKYEKNRHNIGMMLLDSMNERWQEKFKGLYAQENIAGSKVYYLKPQTFMNLSGESVQPLAQFFKIQVADILVIHDELDLPFGTLALKRGGGLAGHNGLKSIAAQLGTQDFLRLRLGIGRPPHGDVSNWVLSDFSKEENIVFNKFLTEGASALKTFLEKGFDAAASSYSRKSVL